ncbi:MAG: right-handed parallel beta-helix repeat-containing protein [Myxococcota bacterium]
MSLSTLAALALGLSACVIPEFPDLDDDDAAGTGEADTDDPATTTDEPEDDGADETAGDDGMDDAGMMPSLCDPEQVAAQVYQHQGSTDGEHWSMGIHIVSGTFTVYGPLSADPCTVIQMNDGARLTVAGGGSLQWQGAPGERITVTSAKTSPAPGDWDHVRIQADAVGPDNVIEFVDFEYGGGSYYGALHLQDGASLEMHDSSVRYSAGLGMVLDGAAELRDFTDNTLTDNATGALSISPDHAGDLGEGAYAPNTVEGIFLHGGSVRHDQTWLAHDAPYVANSGFGIDTSAGSAHLTVEAGAQFRMGDAADIRVGSLGGLTLAGTAADPIVIGSIKSTGEPGDWDEIRIHDDSVDDFNRFSHVILEHGGGSYYGMVWVHSGASLTMNDCTLREAADFGMLVDGGAALPGFEHNTFTANGGAALSVGANEVDSLGTGTYGPNAIDGIIVRSATVDHDARWLDLGVPLLASTGFSVGTDLGSAILTLDPGTRLHLGDAGDIRVRSNGALTTDGTAEQRVQLSSSKASPAAGDWDELRFEDGSLAAHNQLRYTDISYGGGSYYGMLWVHDGTSVSLDNVTFDAPGGGCDLLRDGTVDAVATSFVECS